MAQPPPLVIQLNSHQTPTHTVVFLHGRGDTATKFAASLAYSRPSTGLTLLQTFPTIRWVFPSARPIRLATHPAHPLVSQWFDIWNTNDFTDHEHLQAPGLRDSVAQTRRLLADEAARLNGHWDRVILMGISQGAATSVHTLLNLNIDDDDDLLLPPGTQVQGARHLGAFIGFSCRMPFPGRSLSDTRAVLNLDRVPAGNEALRATPVMLQHCRDDHLVGIEQGRGLRDSLRGFGAPVEWREYEGGGHWFNSPEGIDDAVGFLRRVMDGDEDEDEDGASVSLSLRVSGVDEDMV